MERVKEAFERYGYPQYDEKISVGQMGNVLRYLGRNPSEKEIRDALAFFFKTKKVKTCDFITLPEFIALLKTIPDDNITEEEIMSAIGLFSKDVIKNEFSRSLHYSEDEFDEIIMRKFYPGFDEDDEIRQDAKKKVNKSEIISSKNRSNMNSSKRSNNTIKKSTTKKISK